MRLIDEYLNQLYKKDSSKDVLELKQEMREHLIESVNELIAEGLSEEDSCEKAIERFDGGTEMQQELHTIIKELSTSLEQHKSILKTAKRILGGVAIIGFLVSGLLWYNHLNVRATQNKLDKEFDTEIRNLAEKYDMTNVDDYKKELDKIFEEDRFVNIKGLRLCVADMEPGNISTAGEKTRNKSEVVYEKEADSLANLFVYNSTDFLDIDGNVINPQIISYYSFYNESKTLSISILSFSVLSACGYILIKISSNPKILKRTSNDSKRSILFRRVMIVVASISIAIALVSRFVPQKLSKDEVYPRDIVSEKLYNFNFNKINSSSDKEVFKDEMDEFLNEKLQDKKVKKYLKYVKLYIGKQNSISAIDVDGTTPLNMESYYSYTSEPKGTFSSSDGMLAKTKTKDGYSIYYEVATYSSDLSAYDYSYLVSIIIGVISFVILLISIVFPRVRKIN